MDDIFGCLRSLRISICFRWICKAAVALSGKSRDPKKALSILAFFRFFEPAGDCCFSFGAWGVLGCKFLEKKMQVLEFSFYFVLGPPSTLVGEVTVMIIFSVRPRIWFRTSTFGSSMFFFHAQPAVRRQLRCAWSCPCCSGGLGVLIKLWAASQHIAWLHTPRKIKDTPLEKENHLPNHYFQVLCLFSGVYHCNTVYKSMWLNQNCNDDRLPSWSSLVVPHRCSILNSHHFLEQKRLSSHGGSFHSNSFRTWCWKMAQSAGKKYGKGPAFWRCALFFYERLGDFLQLNFPGLDDQIP